MVLFFLEGIVAGWIIGVPIGPVGILGLRRLLFDGRPAAFASGLAAASGDALFGAMAGFGLNAISRWLLGYREWLLFGAACFLLYAGGSALLHEPRFRMAHHRRSEGLVRDYLSAFVLTIANPTTILGYVGIFAGLGLTRSHATLIRVGSMVIGVGIGSLSWWLLLILGASLFGNKFTPRLLLRVNRISAGILIFLGAGLLGVFVFRYLA